MNTKLNDLTPEEARVILDKGTERPFTGEYYNHKVDGVYICRQCETPLYSSEDKFDSGCGWPSFDDEIPGAVRRERDADGRRTEILCANCGGHLGHVFIGERLTEKNTRHCVNSISMKFIPRAEWNKKKRTTVETATATFASGCFWSKEYFFSKIEGVIATRVGFTGGHKDHPSYKEVCTKTTGHAEAVELTFDPNKVSFETLAKYFFETHDPTIDRRAKGGQYRSAIFYHNQKQKEVALDLVAKLNDNGYEVVTEIVPAHTFWPADGRHQKYCDTRGMNPTDRFTKRF